MQPYFLLMSIFGRLNWRELKRNFCLMTEIPKPGFFPHVQCLVFPETPYLVAHFPRDAHVLARHVRYFFAVFR
jgi:hypothetical protein